MKKNNKGFTMVELLAAIVILGILSVFALPVITRMVENSRNKMYVNDTRKLISQAEYQMKSNSSIIDKPDIGDCIVISLHYLDDSLFSNAPNGGEYDVDHSYVVVKNNNGILEYSASLVEKMKKGGYKGVVLTRESDLLKKKANTLYVKGFDNNDLVDIENDITVTYVNSYLGSNYISGEVSEIYHLHDIEDSNVQIIENSSPIIENAQIDTTGLLNTTLSLKVSDKDTPRNKLQVFIAIDSGYTTENSISYGDGVTFTYDIDFSKYGYSYVAGGKAIVYISVKDPNGNNTEKQLEYNIKKNSAPSINKAVLSAKSGDSANMLTALLTASVTDDLDDYSNLLFCVKESSSSGASDCSKYVSYNSFFTNIEDNEGSLNYTFKECPNGCKRDGSTQYLTLFVKDSMNAVNYAVIPYRFSVNQKPIINGVQVSSAPASFIEDSGVDNMTGSKDIKVSVQVSDDVDKARALNVAITDGVNTNHYLYTGDVNGSIFDFTVFGDYIGSREERKRTISVSVTDSEGATSDVVNKDYYLYLNQAPKVSYFSVRSNGIACYNGKYCPVLLDDSANNDNQDEKITKNGSVNTFLSFSITDDLEANNNYGNILVCFSETKSDCDNDANYQPYSNYSSIENIPFKLNGSYTSSLAERTKTLYLRVKDRYGATSEVERKYVLYGDQAPKIDDDGFLLESRKTTFIKDATGDIKAYLKIIADDDYDTNSLLFTLKDNGVEVISNQPVSSLYTVKTTGEVDDNNNPVLTMVYDYLYSITNQYDGSTHQFEAFVIDSNGYRSASKTFTYKIYQNLAPEKKGVISVTPAYNSMNRALLDVYFNSGIIDDIDSSMQFQYCYKKSGEETPHCIGPLKSSGMAHLTTDNLFSDFNETYNGQKITLYAVATDSGGLSVTSNDVVYTLYKDIKPAIKEATAYYDVDTYDSEAEEHEVHVSFEINASSLEQYSICMSNSSTCNDFSGSYNPGELYTLTYNYPAAINNSSRIYLYANNSVGKSTSRSITISKTNTINNCKFLKEVNEYTYSPRNINTTINPNSCHYKCYHNNTIIGDNNTYAASYRRQLTIHYLDKMNNDASCRSSNGGSVYETKYCDFIDCFKINDSYTQYAVGTFLFDGNWTINIDGITYDLDNYYKLYESSYNPGDKDITLTELEGRICPSCFEDGYYGDQYKIRIAD